MMYVQFVTLPLTVVVLYVQLLTSHLTVANLLDYLLQVQRAKTNNHKEMLTSCKRVAQYCMKHWRQKAMQVS